MVHKQTLTAEQFCSELNTSDEKNGNSFFLWSIKSYLTRGNQKTFPQATLNELQARIKIINCLEHRAPQKNMINDKWMEKKPVTFQVKIVQPAAVEFRLVENFALQLCVKFT